MNNKLLILGTGSYASALAKSLSEKFKEIILYGINLDEINDINQNHQNSLHFPNINLPNNIKATLNIEEALFDTKIIFVALPSVVIEETLVNVVLPKINQKVIWINASKGTDQDYNLEDDFLDLIIPNSKKESVYKICGATFAIEMMNDFPSKLTLTSKSNKLDKNLINLLSTNKLFIEWTYDFLSVNLFSFFKNIFAILQGIIVGLNYEKNTQTFLLIDSLKEVIEIRTNLFPNEKPITIKDFLTSAILGDFILTGTSFNSRNFQYGIEISRNQNWDFQKTTTVEGYNALEIILNKYPEELNQFPILSFLKKVIFEKQNPKNLIQEILLLNN